MPKTFLPISLILITVYNVTVSMEPKSPKRGRLTRRISRTFSKKRIDKEKTTSSSSVSRTSSFNSSEGELIPHELSMPSKEGINLTDDHGNTCLMLAAKENNVTLV